MLRDMHAEIMRVGLAVTGVSPQSPERHREFREKYKLPFTLLSDVEKFVVRMYDLNGPLGLGVRRGTYLIDQARVIRSAVLQLRQQQYVEAAQAIGVGAPRLLVRHILPNCMAILIVQSTFIFADAVLGEASLSFLGAGTPPEIPSWGNMLGDARQYLARAPWTMLSPGAALMLAVLGLNLLGDGVRDLLDPRLRRL